MGRTICVAAAVSVLSLVACTDTEPPGEPVAEAPTWQVELFAPGVVSTELPEFAITFSPSGDSLFFNRTPADRSSLDLFYSVRADDTWSEAELFPPLDGVSAIDPFVSHDGERLYFSSDLEGAGTIAENFNLWWISLGDPGAVPTPLSAPINSDSSDVFNSLARDGRMVFSSRRDGIRAIYEVASLDAPVARVHLAMGGDGSASNPAIHPDGTLLVFASRDGGDAPDLFVSCQGTEGWGQPQRLPAPINSPFTDFAPGFGPGFLYFTSERPGVVGPMESGIRPPGDIYRTEVGPIEELCGTL